MPSPAVNIPTFDQFQSLVAAAHPAPDCDLALPVYRTLLADHLTPVTAFERLAKRGGGQHAFLLESVVGGERIARYSFIATKPSIVIKAHGNKVTIQTQDSNLKTQDSALKTQHFTSTDPFQYLEGLLKFTQGVRLPPPGNLPSFVGGAVGYAGYDTVRYLEPEKLAAAPTDDRHLPDLLFGIYDEIVIFDHVQKTILIVANAHVPTQDSSLKTQDLRQAYDHAVARIDSLIADLQSPVAFELGTIDLTSEARPAYTSNFTQAGFEKAVVAAKEYIKAGDIFQVVLSQRLQTTTSARPFDIYRALRVVNPSPFMFYLTSPECILIGSSPEIMCRVQDGIITNRPLAGTRPRGKTDAEDKALESELLADPKERAEHIMLVDLGRNDVGRAAQLGSVKVSDVLTIERYSHVMHIVSNVSGKLAEDKTLFDALRLALPVGTVSGAPKIRAMQIIDELEPTKRGPYAGAVGYIDFNGNMDTAIALRTMVVVPVVPTPSSAAAPTTKDSAPSTKHSWNVYVQAGAGLVADSVPSSEFQETINKASALLKAVAIAEQGLS